jgi:hypothetical protein
MGSFAWLRRYSLRVMQALQTVAESAILKGPDNGMGRQAVQIKTVRLEDGTEITVGLMSAEETARDREYWEDYDLPEDDADPADDERWYEPFVPEDWSRPTSS